MKGSGETLANQGSGKNQISITKYSTKKNVTVNFDIFEKDEKGQKVKKNMLPVFIKDKNYYTPSFQNDDDKINTEFDRKVHKYLHNDRYKTETMEIDEEDIKQPKPSQKNSYCTICKERFEDYKSHLKKIQHIKKMSSSEFNDDIRQLCKKFQEEKSSQEEEEKINLEIKAQKRIKKDSRIQNQHQNMNNYVEKMLMEAKKKKGFVQSCGSQLREADSWLNNFLVSVSKQQTIFLKLP